MVFRGVWNDSTVSFHRDPHAKQWPEPCTVLLFFFLWGVSNSAVLYTRWSFLAVLGNCIIIHGLSVSWLQARQAHYLVYYLSPSLYCLIWLTIHLLNFYQKLLSIIWKEKSLADTGRIISSHVLLRSFDYI